MKFEIDISSIGERLDKFLHRSFSDLSRNACQMSIKEGKVYLNGKKLSYAFQR